MKIQRAMTCASAVPMTSWLSDSGLSDVVSRSPMALSPQAIIRPAAGGRYARALPCVLRLS